jgi:hypothetical protein
MQLTQNMKTRLEGKIHYLEAKQEGGSHRVHIGLYKVEHKHTFGIYIYLALMA